MLDDQIGEEIGIQAAGMLESRGDGVGGHHAQIDRYIAEGKAEVDEDRFAIRLLRQRQGKIRRQGGDSATAFCAEKDEQFAGLPWLLLRRRMVGHGPPQSGSYFSGVERQGEKFAYAGAHEVDGRLHICLRRVGHHVSAATCADGFHQIERVIRVAVYVNHDNLEVLQRVCQILQFGRERGIFLEPHAVVLG